MKKGATQYIVEDDLPSLRPSDASEVIGHELETALEKQYVVVYQSKLNSHHPHYLHSTLWKAIFVAFGRPYAYAAALKLFQDCLAFLQPQLLRWILAYISLYQNGARLGFVRVEERNPDERPHPLQGFSIAVLMFVVGTTQTVVLNQVSDFYAEEGQDN